MSVRERIANHCLIHLGGTLIALTPRVPNREYVIITFRESPNGPLEYIVHRAFIDKAGLVDLDSGNYCCDLARAVQCYKERFGDPNYVWSDSAELVVSGG